MFDLMRAQAEAGGVSLHLSQLPIVALKIDGRRSRQCVVNLLADDHGRATADGDRAAAPTDPTGIGIRIADTRCGFSARPLEPADQLASWSLQLTSATFA